jgi:hypothetical protein
MLLPQSHLHCSNSPQEAFFRDHDCIVCTSHESRQGLPVDKTLKGFHT